MKKMLCLLLALAMFSVLALAEETAADWLTYKELALWAEGYISRARETVPLNDPANSLTADGYEYIYEFATLYADTPMMSVDTTVNSVVLRSEMEEAPRGVQVGSPLFAVLAAFYTENEQLLGSRENAVLYTSDRLPQSAAWGQVLRDGQRVKTVQYAVHEQMATGGEGYTDAGIIYTMVENRVDAVRVYGLNSRISLEDVNGVMFTMMMEGLQEDYAQVPFSYHGEELEIFAEDDLIFSGMDFLNLTPDAAIALLGEPESDQWVPNGDRGYIRVQTFPGCELTYLFNEARTQGQVYMLDITADGLEGPRAVRVGDTFASVYNRFRNGEGELEGVEREVLYGEEGRGSFGEATYGLDASATLRYGFHLTDGRKVVLDMTFTVMECTEIMLFVR